MPKGSTELTNSRKEEIINACETLYQTMSFRDITIKEIGNVTSFKRTSIYNYFATKEEIFLALLQREYEYWVNDLNQLIETHDVMSTDELASALAHSLEKRKQLLKIMSMNIFDMESNSRIECLVEFKKVYGKSINAVINCLEKFCTQMDEQQIQNFVYEFFPFIYGIYPYTSVTEKQREAMKKAGINYIYKSIYEIAYTCTKKLLDVK